MAEPTTSRSAAAQEKAQKAFETATASRRDLVFDIAPTFVVARDKTGLLGRIDFEVKGDTLIVVLTDVEPASRKQGLSQALMAKVILEHPNIKRTESVLSGVNRSVFRESVAAGLTVEQALRKTPAYLVREKLGFGRLMMDEIKRLKKPAGPQYLITELE